MSGQLAMTRGFGGRVLMGLFERDGRDTVVGGTVFDPAFPGAYPFRAARPELAFALLRAIRPYARPSDLHVKVVSEGQPAIADALIAAGARVVHDIVHMKGRSRRATRSARIADERDGGTGRGDSIGRAGGLVEDELDHRCAFAEAREAVDRIAQIDDARPERRLETCSARGRSRRCGASVAQRRAHDGDDAGEGRAASRRRWGSSTDASSSASPSPSSAHRGGAFRRARRG